MRPDVVIRSLARNSVTIKPLAKQFLCPDQSLVRFAIGKNEESLALNRIVPLQGLIDDYAREGSYWSGIPLLKTSAVCKEAIVANCSTSISPVAVNDHLRSSGLRRVIGFHELVLASEGRLAWPAFVQSFRNEISTQCEAWQRIYETLADSESRKTFNDVIRYRYAADPEYMQDYRVRLQEQYFEDFMGFKNEVFVDVGGFDGDTSEIFASRYADYERILFFEPSARNMSAARLRLAKVERIYYYSIGLSDRKETLRFNQDAGSASYVTREGDSVIEVDTLDSLVKHPVSFIKMDLEGWELRALYGASNHIMHERPKLAIAVYHDSSDFRLIFEFIESICLNYKMYLRHYTQGWSETIMFFKP